MKRALDHLLETVAAGDWAKYEVLCDKKITVWTSALLCIMYVCACACVRT